MKTLASTLALAVVFAGATTQAQSDTNPLGQILRGLAQGLLQKQSGKVPPLRQPQGYPGDHYGRGPHVWNISDNDGNSGTITQGEMFHILGQGFGNREGQVALLPEGSDQWIVLRGRSIQSWRDDQVRVVVAEPLIGARNATVTVAVVTAEGVSDAINGIVFRNSSGGRPLPPVPGTRPQPGYDPGYVGRAPENVTWSVAAVEGSPNESPRDTLAAQTLGSLGGAPASGSAGSNTRLWAGATIGLMTMGTPTNPPWHHFVVGIAAGSPNAARLASTVAAAGARGASLRPTQGPTPPGGYPLLAVSKERLRSDQQMTDAVPEREACDVDARLLREALRLSLPPDAGKMRLGTIDEIGRAQCGEARSVIKCLSGEARNLTVLVFLSRTDEPYRRRDGRMDWRSARSVRVAVLGNGSRTHEDCCRVFDDR